MSTQQDIADALGVSKTTVSEVLRDYEGCTVSARMRARIHATAKRLNYVPNPLAVGLRTGRSRIIGAMVPYVFDHATSLVLTGLIKAVDERGYTVNIQITEGLPERERQAVQFLRSQHVAGVFVLRMLEWTQQDCDLAVLDSAGVPLITPVTYPGWEFNVAAVDSAGAGRLAAGHLVAAGHERTVFLRGAAIVAGSTSARLARGFMDALAEAGLPAGEERVFGTPGTSQAYSDGMPADPASVPLVRVGDLYQQGHDAARNVLDSETEFTAVLCDGDEMAVGAIAAFQKAGLKVPGDVAVMGNDNEPFGAFSTVPLTTIDPGFEQVGRRAGEILIDQIANEERRGAAVHENVEPQLVVRESC